MNLQEQTWEVKKAVLELDNSYLAIQGPPGTGKDLDWVTFNSLPFIRGKNGGDNSAKLGNNR